MLLDKDCLAGIVVGDIIDTFDTYLNIHGSGGESLAEFRLEDIVRISWINSARRIGLRSTDSQSIIPVVVGADLELVTRGQFHAADNPDVTIDVGHINVGRPAVTVDGSDERPDAWFLRFRSITISGRLILAIHRGIKLNSLLVEIKVNTVLAGGHGDVVRSDTCILAPVVIPSTISTELDLCVGCELGVSPESYIILVVVHLDVRIRTPIVESTDNADDISAPVLRKDKRVLVKGESIEPLAVADDVLRASTVDELDAVSLLGLGLGL